MRLSCQRDRFSIPDEIAYLNTAYMGPLPLSAQAAIAEATQLKAQPWRIKSDDFFALTERARGLFAGLIGSDADHIALIPSASYGLATAAVNLTFAASKTKIIALEGQFPSNVYVWRELARQRNLELVHLPRPENGNWTAALLERLDDSVALLALPNCHWSDGGLVELNKLTDARRRHDIALVVDATQSVGALPTDIALMQPDFLIAAAYKWMLCPYTVGFMYVSERYANGKPLEYNWITRKNSDQFAELVNYRDEFEPGMRRYDMGQRTHLNLLPAACRSLELIQGWGVDAIYDYVSAITRRIADQSRGWGYLATDQRYQAGHMLGLRMPDSDDAVTGVGMAGTGNKSERIEVLRRNLEAEQVHVSVRGDAVRISPYLYTNDQDVERLLAVLQKSAQ